MEIELLIANWLGGWRIEEQGGRRTVVAPISLLVPGVLNGSQGPLYYPAEEVSANVSDWNGMPLVWKHPKDVTTGRAVSARDPLVWHRSGLGHVYRTAYNGKLTAEAWIDEERANALEPRILATLKAGGKIEISTGLFTKNEKATDNAAHNGTPYTHVARAYRPDHVAVLLDEPGACGVRDGCGLNVNHATDEQRKTFWEGLLGFLGIHKQNIQPPAHPAPTVTPAVNTTPSPGDTPVDRTATILWLTTNCDCWKKPGDKELLEKLPDANLSALKTGAEKLKQQEAVANAATQGFYQGNRVTFNTATQQWEATPAPSPTGNGSAVPPATTPVSAVAPPLTAEQLEDLDYARNAKNQEKTHLIGRITANVADDQKATRIIELQRKSLADLREIASYLPPAPSHDGHPPIFALAGAGNPAQPTMNQHDADDYLPIHGGWQDLPASDTDAA